MIYTKDKRAFLKIYESELAGLVFWRYNEKNPNKVDIKIASYFEGDEVEQVAKSIIEKLPD